ncbi:MAG: hypothetical protein LBE95_03795 [Holosporaceae bacterium]|jgi:hypothetical protein|nr:hypothetical protein [Holosporaceae bacterium]
MVDFLIDEYGVPKAWTSGDVVHPNEPHNIQQYQVSPDQIIFFGRFVVRNFADDHETVMLPPVGKVYRDLLGVSLNTNSFHMVDVDSSTKMKAYKGNDIVPVGMIDTTFSVAMDMVIQDGTTDVLTAPLSVICSADNTAGKLYVGTTPPANSIALISDKFSLRTRQDIKSSTNYYLYIKAGTQLQTDYNQTDTTKADFLKNKPALSTKTINSGDK